MPLEIMPPNLAKEVLQECLKDGQIKPTRHFLDELTAEDLTFPDAWHVLRTGTIYLPAEHDIKTGDWKYKIEGYEPEGKWIQIVFCFKSVKHANLITIFSDATRKKP